MTLKIFTISTVTTGVVADLGTNLRLFVPEGVTISSTGNDAVVASGSGQFINIQGTVTADFDAIKILNISTYVSNDQIMIGENGYVASDFATTAIEVYADDSVVTNRGVIEGYNGINLQPSSVAGDDHTSAIYNYGAIRGLSAGVIVGSAHTATVHNYGTIEGQDYGVNCVDQSGALKLFNDGKISGGVGFGAKNDTYEGHDGTVSGRITGNAGDDTFVGGKGVDFFEGDAGSDRLTGNGGADHFIFMAATDSTDSKSGRDIITDFSHAQHDRIDLSAIDTNPAKGNDQAFNFIGTAAFDGQKGELHYAFDGNHTLIIADIDGDKHADFEIELGTHVALTKGDFIL
jgi:Ca2+-binding RTX toxin-like protein